MLGKQRGKHRSKHARKLLDYAKIRGDLADNYFALHAYINAENQCDTFQRLHRARTDDWTAGRMHHHKGFRVLAATTRPNTPRRTQKARRTLPTHAP